MIFKSLIPIEKTAQKIDDKTSKKFLLSAVFSTGINNSQYSIALVFKRGKGDD